ncbi:MAG: hypothetical protein HY042_12555 [Spirochaetia bacterium]|nr:hypothetical protein [Spirochaetia bacterium]
MAEQLHLKEPSKSDLTRNLLIALGIVQAQGDYYAKLYYVSPLITTGETNKGLIWEATAADVTAGKKKLVLVHGWHFDDRDGFTYPTPDQLKDRILAQNWTAYFQQNVEFDPIINTKNYDIYAFDYLTSNGVDVNGARFRAKMDALFNGAADTGKVVIYAHSMGGLVTRFAVYQNLAAPAYITRIITTGTPYHGSPWASPEFQADHSTLGSLAGFMTNTTGGQDLRWDNFDGSITGSSNPKLTAINAKTDRDSLFYRAIYGQYNTNATASTCGDAGASGALLAACRVLGGTAGGTSDCVVPVTSATLSGHTFTAGTLNANNGGGTCGLDHLDVKMGTAFVRSTLYGDLP